MKFNEEKIHPYWTLLIRGIGGWKGQNSEQIGTKRGKPYDSHMELESYLSIQLAKNGEQKRETKISGGEELLGGSRKWNWERRSIRILFSCSHIKANKKRGDIHSRALRGFRFKAKQRLLLLLFNK
ncbi:hypothetical protein CEXT_389601 [Caerostris extrusa]|uniref:Uncharacterized protein n=1 Tax=Caerostris extrusa TaxID=172846 RepID=A0AAV4WWV8_CAEEX|nr:hypothetical protein CEXT_389601 [Caerostris extrusa]